MVRVGALQLLAIGFEASHGVPADVIERVGGVCRNCRIRVIDVSYVSKDARGVLRVEPWSEHFVGDGTSPDGTVLWQLLKGDSSYESARAPLEFRGVGEIGLDLVAVEQLQYRIEPETAALFVLVEATWPTELIDPAIAAGGFPLLCGFLEPETMFVAGPEVARAVEVADAVFNATKARAETRVDALVRRGPPSVALRALRTLVDANVVDWRDLDHAIDALVGAGLVKHAS